MNKFLFMFFPADPGLFFIVTQGTIRYVHLTESTFNMFFAFFEGTIPFLMEVDAHILGMLLSVDL